MLSKENKLEILDLIESIITSTCTSRHQVSYDEDYGDCVYTLKKTDLLRTIDKIKKDL